MMVRTVQFSIRRPVAINQGQCRHGLQLINGSLHAEHRGLENIHPVDLLRPDFNHCPGGTTLDNPGIQFLPAFAAQLF